MRPLQVGSVANPGRARGTLAARLHARRPEIERAVMTRVRAVSSPGETTDPEYLEGLRAAVSAALDYGLAVLEQGEERAPPIPTVLLAQARLAARNGVSLDTVLRRYIAGHTLFGDFLIEEAGSSGPLDGDTLQRLLRSQATLLDRLLAEVTDDYSREAEGRLRSKEERRTELVRGLLAGEQLHAAALNYEFEAHHVGLVGSGLGARETICGLAASLDARLLAVCPGAATAWAWLGFRSPPDTASLESSLGEELSGGVRLAIGEPGEGLAGWRLTHRQAAAALPVAIRGSGGVVRYSDVALLATTLQDEVLCASLRRLFLEPLAAERDGGCMLRETLRAYFGAGRNITSAAAELGVDRSTVSYRLHTVESRLGRQLNRCTAELEAALRLEQLGEVPKAGAALAIR